MFQVGDRVKHKHLGFHGTITKGKNVTGAVWDEHPEYGVCKDPENSWEKLDTDWDEEVNNG